MNVRTLNKFKGGWVVGNFSPAVLRTKKFEFSVKKYRKGDCDDTHYHKKAIEVTVVVSGQFRVNGKKLGPGSVFMFKPREVSSFACLKNGYTAVVKTRSVKGDKYIVEKQ